MSSSTGGAAGDHLSLALASHLSHHLTRSTNTSPSSVLEGEGAEPPLHLVDVRDARANPPALEVLHNLRGNLRQNVLKREKETS